MPNIAQFQQDAYPATDELQCITVYLPAGDEFKWLLAGLMRLTAMTSSYADPESAQADGLAAIWQDAYDLVDWTPCMDARAQGELTIWQLMGTVANGGAFTTGTLPNQGQYTIQTGAANNDQWHAPMWLAAGTYELTILHYKNSNGGLAQFDVQTSTGTLVQSLSPQLQFYNATIQYLQKQTWTVTIPTDGLYRLYSQVAGKHASSSGYNCPISLITMRKTS